MLKRHLILTVFAVYGQVWHYELLEFDDPVYVTNNPYVLSGLNRGSVVWAISSMDAGFWHPLTWLSLMLDSQLYGTNAGGFHLTNVLLHTASTLLLFLALSVMRLICRATWWSNISSSVQSAGERSFSFLRSSLTELIDESTSMSSILKRPNSNDLE